MPKISVRPDRDGQQAVYCGRTLLLDGLAAGEAESFAAFFRAADRALGGRAGQSVPCTDRSRAVRAGALATRGGFRARP